MSPPEMALGAARPAHWTVKTNYRLRTGSFLDMFACIVLHGWGKSWSPVLWAAIGLHLLAYPHLVYWLARRSPRSQEAEVNNLTVDCLLFGLLMGALQFPLWITFTVYIASTMNITISRGWSGLARSQVASLGGALVAVGLFGWHPSPDTGWPSIWLCVLGNAVYLSCIGIVAHSRNQQLRETREALRAGELALKERFSEIQALQDQLQEQAIRDPLTGLFNRRFLESTVVQELARCARDGVSMALVMIDVDHFKKVNDTFGHPAGDQVLKALATRLQAEVRASDCACRYGGEEFILLLPGMDVETAWTRADRWRQAFAEDTVTFGELRLQATISIGIAAFPAHGDSLAELTRCADQALYDAKHTGRNRVVVYRDRLVGTAAASADGSPACCPVLSADA
jgi:diguanylate cyclase (GGDEF)-like protein